MTEHKEDSNYLPKLYKKEDLSKEKREPDECLIMALEIYLGAAALAGYGGAYIETYTIPESKIILENKIYTLVDNLLTKIKVFDEKCLGIPVQYSENIEKLGELNYQRMSQDAIGIVSSFEEIILAICGYLSF